MIPTYFLFTHLAVLRVKQVNMMIWPNLMVTRRQKTKSFKIKLVNYGIFDANQYLIVQYLSCLYEKIWLAYFR